MVFAPTAASGKQKVAFALAGKARNSTSPVGFVATRRRSKPRVRLGNFWASPAATRQSSWRTLRLADVMSAPDRRGGGPQLVL